jgi:hypothetical protein
MPQILLMVIVAEVLHLFLGWPLFADVILTCAALITRGLWTLLTQGEADSKPVRLALALTEL